MPIPKRKKGERKSTFISRCIKEMKRRDKDRPHMQIVAICFAEADRK